MPKNTQQFDTIQRCILDNLSTAVVLLNHRLCVQYLNPAAENLFHISNQRAQNILLSKIIFITEAFSKRLNQTINEQHPIAEHEVSMTVGIDKHVTVDYMITPLQNPQHNPLIMLELSQLDRHLRIAREEKLLSEQTATRNIIRGMAHEIKNPLGGIRGSAQLLERELPNDDLKEYTNIIIGETDRLQTLVDRMLGPKNLPKKQIVNIHQILEHVRSLVLAEENSSQIFFKLDYDPSIPELSADPDLLIQAILNITRNAMAALEGSGEITVKTRPQRNFTIGHQHHRLVMQVDIIDNGPGIPADLQEQIFFPMVTGRADGTGLGLSIAQSLINQHAGLIEVNSRPGKTRFTIYLPFGSTK